MPGLTFILSEYPFDWIELACEACERRGRLRKARLIEQYGSQSTESRGCATSPR
jgi:hypothetical protein